MSLTAKRPSRLVIGVLGALGVLAAGPSTAAFAGPAKPAARWYVVLQPTDQAPGVTTDLLQTASTLLHDEFAHRPEWAIDLGDAPAAPDALATYLKAHHLVGYTLHARILDVSQSLLPPPAGKRSKILEVTVKLTLVGAGATDGKLAIGGDGESTVDAEVGDAASPGDVRQAESDALADAIKTAVDDATRRLAAAKKAHAR